MKFPKNALNYWDEGQKVRHLNWNLKRNNTQFIKRLGLKEWYKKGFWKRYFRKKMSRKQIQQIEE
jgi:hypothetical protein